MHQLVPQFILRNDAAGITHGLFPAAGMFVDVSGFSDMTDALMQHGQHGAEILAGVMRATFDPLMRSVFEQGGFVCSQAGDAFTALFSLEEDPSLSIRRALAAAWNAQQRASAQPVFDTPYGTFSISIKVGMALGEAGWGIAGSEDDRRAAYYFSGSTIDGCAEAEKHARAGEIVLEENLYAQVSTLVDAEPVDGCFRLTRLDFSLPEPAPVEPPEVDLELAGRYYPRELFTQLHSGEFRQVAYLFVRLPTVRTESQLRIFMQTVFQLQDQYGGVLELLFGDKGAHLALMWGLPVAHENDIERALGFVLELQNRTAIPVNAGLSYRVAHAGFIGGELAEEYTAYGRGPNLAARFMTSAARGEIWVDENIARRAEKRFDLEYAGEKILKGFSQPQKVFILLERKEEPEAFFEGAFASRSAEIGRLNEFILPVFSGKYAGVMVVWGEPGIGKSRLIYEFLSGLEAREGVEFQSFLGQTDEIMRLPLNPFRYWLRRYFHISEMQGEARNKRSFNRKLDELLSSASDTRLVEELDRTRSFLGALVDLYWPDSLYEQLDARGRHENTFIALATLLQVESLRRPLVFILEDAHWLDDDSKAFLPHLIRTLTADERRSYPFALLATARHQGSPLPLEGYPYQELALGHLNRSGLQDLAEHQLHGPVAESLLDLLDDRSDGNPFFAEQILHYLNSENLLSPDPQGWCVIENTPANLPVDVSAMLVARMDNLPREVKEMVQTAAVLGREFEVSLLSHMLKGDPALPERLLYAERETIWAAMGEHTYLFKHALMRDAAYDMLLRSRRQVLHAAALEAIQSTYADTLTGRFGELAYHALQAGLEDTARRYYEQAGAAARSLYQNSLALEYYTRALSLTPPGGLSQRYELLLELEYLHRNQGNSQARQQDLQALEEISSALNQPAVTAKILFRRCSFAYDLSKYTEAQQLAQQSIELAMSIGDSQLAADSYNLLAACLIRHDKYDQVVDTVQSGLRVARAAADRLNESRLLNTLGMNLSEQGKQEEARRSFEQSLHIAVEIGDLRAQALAHNNLGMATGYQGDYQFAREEYEKSLQLVRKIGERPGEGILLGNLGYIAGNFGNYRLARKYAEQNLRIAREAGDRRSETYGLINLSGYACALGDFAAAQASAEEARALASEIGDRSGEAWAFTKLADSKLEMGKLVEALDAYRLACDIRKELEQPSLEVEPMAGHARAALAAGDLEDALHCVDSILAHLDSGGTTEGTDQPLRVYLTCYRVLDVASSPRAAAILETAYHQLQSWAEKIHDENGRREFIENIAHHHEIVEIWRERSRSASPL